MDIAVHYRKFELDDEKCFFIPMNVIYGEYEKNAEMFFSESGMICYPIKSKSALAHDYFSSPKTITELVCEYGEGLSNDELISSFFYDVKDNCYIGLYNEDNITVLRVQIYKIEEEIISTGKCEYASFFNFYDKANKSVNFKKQVSLQNSENKLNKKENLKVQLNEISKKLKELESTKKNKVKLEWDVVTPYNILGIDEKDYTKQELLKILSDRVNKENAKKINHKKKVKRIDSYLDAYNEIMKKSNND